MELNDLFVSYKQVHNPDTIKSFELFSFKPFSFYYNEENTDKENTESKTEESSEKPVTFTPIGVKTSTTSTKKSSSKWVSPYVRNRNKWIQDMTNTYKKYGLKDNAIKNLLAKNALESGWGKFAQGNYNFGNITIGSSWKGDYVKGSDKDANGKPISQKFRVYSSIDDYVKDEIQFLTKLYDFNQDDSFDVFINKLQGGNKGKRFYAQATDYANRVKSVYNSL